MRVLLVDGLSPEPAPSWPAHETAFVTLGREVPGMIREFKPDVIVLNVPSPNAVRIAKMLQEDWPSVRIIVTHFSPSSSV